MMKAFRRLAGIGVLLLLAGPAAAQESRREIEQAVRDYLARNPQELQRVVRDTLVNNPDLLREMMAEALRPSKGPGTAPAPAMPAAPDKARLVRENAEALFNSPHQVTLGNRDGDVTLVEFFDYSCGFCKRGLADKLALVAADPKLRLVLKELPILGPRSTEIARIAVAVRMQDEDGGRSLEFHKRLLGDPLPAGRERALAVAGELGLDMGRLVRDETSEEVRQTFEENAALARKLGINGTPTYVVGENVIIGAVGGGVLKGRIAEARGR